jgi:DNA polymerase
VPAALRAIRAGDTPEDLEMLFEDSALGVVASCLRSTIMAGPLQRLAIADFSQIEARVLAWLAGQQDALDVFHQGKDIYIATANRLGSDNRAFGKVCVLALGYGMGHEKFRATSLTYGLVLDEYEAAAAVTLWRGLNNRIVNLWWESHKALLRALRGRPGTMERVGYVTFINQPRALLARLPSGRHLVYRHPRIELNERGYEEFTYMGSLGGNWTRLRAWPGKIVENLTQAVARDVMVEAMLKLKDLPLIATIHDELIAEVDEDDADQTLARMLAAMRLTPAWASGLPVDAAGFVVKRYQKG